MVSLSKRSDGSDSNLSPAAQEADRRVTRVTLRGRCPWYPLAGHRSGLRANDPVSLASAFMILALEGATAHMSVDLKADADQHHVITR